MAGKTPDDAANQLRLKPGDVDPLRVQEKIIKQARVAMIADVRDNFRNSADPDGTPWAALRHPRPRGGNRPLMDTGILRASVVTAGPAHVEVQTVRSIEIGTAQMGARLMHEGGVVVPKKAKALAIPLTKEAVRAGGPRRFPNTLTMLWRKGANSGVLAEINTKKVSKREKSLRKQESKLVPRERKYMDRIKTLRERAKRQPKSVHVIEKKIELIYAQLKAFRRSIAGKVRQREALADKRRSGTIKVHYALVKSVRIVARPFVGFGKRLVAIIDSIVERNIRQSLGGKP